MILVFSGTKDGREIISRLLDKEHEVIVSTATRYGADLIKKRNNLDIIYGQLSLKDIQDLIKLKGIDTIVDATHPYAQNISETLIEVCNQSNTKLYRYERESIDKKEIKKYDTYTDICRYLNTKDGNILITTGSKNSKLIIDSINRDRLYIRVLPIPKVLNNVINFGFKPSQIIAMQGPFCIELNKALFKQYNIKYILTKDSGLEGGTLEKIEAAIESNVEIIMLKRPMIEYKNRTNSIKELLENIN
ncbi:precorrin-6A reductase [Clostridiaceae bacterium M8S5]|nr:precorrin-6A reductase [Clostridiaceae bacterium M8S5]